jgi:D-arginine dehydrogenase
MVESYDILVVGGGIAGISLAARLGGKRRRVALIEMEDWAPKHATGRSASLKDPIYTPNADVAALAMASAELFAEVPGALRPKGALHLYGGDSLAEYADALARCRDVGAHVDQLEADQVVERFPFLRMGEEHCVAALYAPPGVANTIDVRLLYEHFRRRFCVSGGDVIVSEALESGRLEARGWTVVTSSRVIRADIIVNCAGAWADIVAARCGISALGLLPLKWTVLDTTVAAHPLAPQPDGPFIFWEGAEPDLYCDFKFGGRLLLSPADEQVSQPCDASPEIVNLGIALDRFYERTHLAVVNTRGRHWAGLRTFAADRRPVIGWSGERPGFFWSGAYGGFGIECSLAASAIAADMILGEDRFKALMGFYGVRSERFDPDRLRVLSSQH